MFSMIPLLSLPTVWLSSARFWYSVHIVLARQVLLSMSYLSKASSTVFARDVNWIPWSSSELKIKTNSKINFGGGRILPNIFGVFKIQQILDSCYSLGSNSLRNKQTNKGCHSQKLFPALSVSCNKYFLY